MPPFETERLSDDRGVVVAGGWLLPAPSRTLRVTAPAFEVFRRRRAVTDPSLRKNRNRADPLALAPLQSSHCCPGRTRPPLVGFVRRCVPKPRLSPQPGSGADLPSTDPGTRKRVPSLSRRASTPAYVAARFGRRGPSLQSRSVLVVLHHLDGFLRSEVAGLLHPAAGHGVRRVSRAGFPIRDLASQIVAGRPKPSSRRTSYPPKASSTAAVPRRRGRCPRAVSRRSRSARRDVAVASAIPSSSA